MIQLPMEVMLEILDSMVVGSIQFAYPPSHWKTKLFLAFTRVSKATSNLATRLLYQHCVYLDSDTRLRQLHRTLLGSAQPAADKARQSQRGDYLKTFITSLYLSPFPGYAFNDGSTITLTAELLCMLHTRVRRLVVDFRFASLYPAWQEYSQWVPTLKTAFAQLRGLKEFTCVNDALGLLPDTPLWMSWPTLTRLSLFEVADDELIHDGIVQLPLQVTDLVLVQSFSVKFDAVRLARGASKLRVLMLGENAHAWNPG